MYSSSDQWYKKADVHDVAVEIFDDTAILWNRITLEAIVRGNEALNQFTVTEVYKKTREWLEIISLNV